MDGLDGEERALEMAHDAGLVSSQYYADRMQEIYNLRSQEHPPGACVRLDGSYYKIGRHGLVFRWDAVNREWRRALRDRGEVAAAFRDLVRPGALT